MTTLLVHDPILSIYLNHCYSAFDEPETIFLVYCSLPFVQATISLCFFVSKNLSARLMLIPNSWPAAKLSTSKDKITFLTLCTCHCAIVLQLQKLVFKNRFAVLSQKCDEGGFYIIHLPTIDRPYIAKSEKINQELVLTFGSPCGYMT